ncbi:MAG TPA: hypothetical protein DEP72_03540 [Clostridiales bacterium]|nr:MAG: hypothetical protein A2Y18_00710 [Clostridiales bacterium GWD2_32_19]HCC07226.1 hypothetical protein [Clostridiales bacterium]
MKNENSMLICPVCKGKIALNHETYICESGHCYDIAREGYVNLLTVNQKKSNSPGDNKIMMNARKDFLEKGYYDVLIDEIDKEIKLEDTVESCVDIGCGEGYYTSKFRELNKNINFIGMDISKEAIKKASKRREDIIWVVGGSNNIPIMNNSIDIIVQIFAPHNVDEYLRIMKTDAKLITVTPGEEHLLKLKELLYEDVYLNDQKYINDERLSVVKEDRVSMKINVSSGDDISNLLKMTPYYYRTNEDKIEELCKLEKLETEIDFNIRVYKRK